MKKFHLIKIEGDVEPIIIGRYDDYKTMLARARKERTKSDEDGLFYLFVNAGSIGIHPFGGAELEDD